jgi:hypothetical protein
MQDRPELADVNLQQEFAKGLIGLLRAHVDMVEQLQKKAMSEPARLAAQERLEAGSRRAIAAAVPQAAEAPAPKKSSSLIDDPEFEATLLQLADDRGWWQDDPDEIVEQFDWMLVGLMALQEEYVRYCARKKLDPASALPSIARLAVGLGEVAAATGIAATTSGPAPAAAAPAAEAALTLAAPAPESEPARITPPADAAAALTAPATPVTSQGLEALDPTPISALALRYLDLRSAGYMLERKKEQPHAKSEVSFRANSRRNIEATVGLFIDLVGDLAVTDLQDHHCADFVRLLERIPAKHGKSAKDRRPVRTVIEQSDLEEAQKIEKIRACKRREGRSPGEIEDAIAEARIERLRTNTCLRHMRDFSRILDFAVFDGLRRDNPMKEHI